MNDRTRNIGVIFTADTDSLTRGYSVAQAATMSFAKTVESQMWGATAATKGLSEAFSQFDMTSISSIQKMLTTGFVGYSAFSVLKTIGQNTINLQNEQAQLAAVLESTGRSANMTTHALNEMASAMSRASMFSGGEITQAQYTLLAFTGIAQNEFPRAMQAAADMAARTGVTIKSAAETVGRALDVPSQGLSSLTRQGFRFTEEQKKLAQHLEATGRTAEAQAIILDALEESYKGAAQAARDTFGGAWTSLLNNVGDLATGSDSFFGPITSSINALNEVLSSGEAEAAIHGLTMGVQLLSAVLAGRLVVSLGVTSASFVSSTIATARYKIALMEMLGVSRAAAIGVTSLGVAARAAGAAMSLLLGPVGIVAALAGSAAIAVYNYRDSLSDSSSVVGDFGLSLDELKEKWKSLTIVKNESLRFDYISEAETKSKELVKARNELIDAAEFVVGHGFSGSTEQLVEFDIAVTNARGDVTLLTQVMREAERAGVIGSDSAGLVIGLANAVEKATDAHKVAIGVLDEHTRFLDGFTSATNQAAGAQQGLSASLSAEYIKFDASVSRQIALMGKSGQAAQLRYDLERGEMSKWSDDEKKLAAQRINALEQAEKAEEARRKASRSSGKQSNELQNLIKRLDEQKSVLGMTAEQAERYKITTMAGSAADRARALSLFDQVQAWKEADKAIKQAQESSKIFAATQRELDLFSQSFDIEIAGLGLGDRARELLEKENEIRRDFAERRTKLEEGQQSELTKLDEKSYAERLRMLESSESQKVQILRQKTAEKLAAENDWLSGVSRAFDNYVERSNNTAAQAESAFAGLFDGATDAAARWAVGLDTSFSSVVQSFAQMLIKMQMQAAASSVFQWLGFGLGGMGSGNLTGGSLSGASWFGPSSAGSGGLTGLGMLPGRERGGPVLAGGMYQVNEAGVPELLEVGGSQFLMMAGQSGHVTPLASASRSTAQPLSPSSSAFNQAIGPEPKVSIHFHNDGATATSEATPGLEEFAKIMQRIAREEYQKMQLKSHRPGGMAWGDKQKAFS